MSADAVDFRLNLLHSELLFRHQVDFVLQTMKKHTDLKPSTQKPGSVTSSLLSVLSE